MLISNFFFIYKSISTDKGICLQIVYPNFVQPYRRRQSLALSYSEVARCWIQEVTFD